MQPEKDLFRSQPLFETQRGGIGEVGDAVKACTPLGVEEQVAREGWGSVSSRDCGRMVQKAIDIAERSVNPK